MKRRNFLHIASGLSLGALVGVAGCGGGKNTDFPTSNGSKTAATGRIEMSLRWPDAPAEAAASRLIPQASRSVRVRLLQNATIIGQRILVRDPSVSTATFSFDDLPVGDYTMISEAFSTTSADGTALAQATAPVTVTDGQSSSVRLTMASTVATLQITSPSYLFVGNTAPLQVTGRDANGNTVLIGAGALNFESSDTSLLTVDATGTIKALKEGSATVRATDTESGKTAQVACDVYLPGPFQPVPLYLYDERRTGRAGYPSKATGVVKWTFNSPKNSGMSGAQVIDSDGTIYFSINIISDTDRECFIYALDGQTGAKKWEFLALSDPNRNALLAVGPLSLGGDGAIYFGTQVGADSGFVVALNRQTGTVKWQYNAGRAVISSPLIDKNGVLYVGTGGTGLNPLAAGSILALDSVTGAKKWETSIINGVTSPPSLAPNGTLYFTTGRYLAGTVYALDSTNGVQKWKANFTDSECHSAPVIGDDGTLYIGTLPVPFNPYSGNDPVPGGVYALDGATGTKKWFYPVSPTALISTPSVGKDGTLYISDSDVDNGAIYSLTSTGVLRWKFQLSSYTLATPIITPNGIVYCTDSGNGAVYALDAATGTKKWQFIGKEDSVDQPVAIGKDGTAYFSYSDGTVYALV